MHFQKNVSFLLVLLVILFGLTVYNAGCTKSTSSTPALPPDIFTIPQKTNYKKFELKSDDIRLKYFKNPLYSFEYPEVFNLSDENLLRDEPTHIFHSEYSIVFFIIQQIDLPEPILEILVQNPGFLDRNTSGDVIKYLTSLQSTKWHDTNISTKKVAGIQADYLKTFSIREEWRVQEQLIYPEHYSSLRGVAFDYAGLIWVISMTWHYFESEPPEIQGYFNHVIETFKILE
jgi:hypothetical protein